MGKEQVSAFGCSCKCEKETATYTYGLERCAPLTLLFSYILSPPPKFNFQIFWNERHCSTLIQRNKLLWCLHTFFPSNHAPQTKDLKLKLCEDTAPSSYSDSSLEGNNRTTRNSSYQANSPAASFPLVASLLLLTGSYIIPASCYVAWIKAQRHTSWWTHSPSNLFIASKATSNTKNVAWFPSPFWELTFPLIWSTKPKPCPLGTPQHFF